MSDRLTHIRHNWQEKGIGPRGRDVTFLLRIAGAAQELDDNWDFVNRTYTLGHPLPQKLRNALSVTESAQCITHGRHCSCRACAAQDWSEPNLACCGMHGPGCPGEYQPLGRAGEPAQHEEECKHPLGQENCEWCNPEGADPGVR